MSRVRSQSDLVDHRQSRSLRPRQHTSFAACVVPDVQIIAAVVTQVILLICVVVIKIPLLTCPREPGPGTHLVKMGWDSECVEPGTFSLDSLFQLFWILTGLENFVSKVLSQG